MEYISVKEAANRWGVTSRMVSYYCASGRISGTQKIGNMWVIPRNAPKPEDGRKRRKK
jgi:predicted site-specific integrase-resolvase